MGVRWLQFSLGACAVGFLSCAFCLVSIFGDLRLFLRDSQHELTQFKEISDDIWDSFLKDAPEIFATPAKSRTIRQANYVQNSYVNGAQTTRAPYGAPSIRPTKPPGCNCQNEKNNCPAGPPGPKGQRVSPECQVLPETKDIPDNPVSPERRECLEHQLFGRYLCLGLQELVDRLEGSDIRVKMGCLDWMEGLGLLGHQDMLDSLVDEECRVDQGLLVVLGSQVTMLHIVHALHDR
ncbi:unnamed protein product, partial [Mesorhabditis spiculigera]